LGNVGLPVTVQRGRRVHGHRWMSSTVPSTTCGFDLPEEAVGTA